MHTLPYHHVPVVGSYTGLGLVASNSRRISSGTELASYFGQGTGKEQVLAADGSTFDTIRFINELSAKYAYQAKAIARHLKRPTTEATLRAIWTMFYRYFDYKLDPPDREQIKSLLASFRLRKHGIDCDDYAMGIAQILICLHIPFVVRKIQQKGRDGFHHVYIIVPKHPGANLNQRSSYWVLDPVVNSFNEEPQFIQKKYDAMHTNSLSGPITFLNGVDDNQLAGLKENKATATIALRSISGLLKIELQNMQQHPDLYKAMFKDPMAYRSIVQGFLNKTSQPNKYATLTGRALIISAFKVASAGSIALVNVRAVKEMGQLPGKVGVFDTITASKAFDNLTNASVVGKLSNILAGAMRFNPGFAILRAGTLKSIELNLPFRHDIAAKLYPGVVSESAAASVGYSNVQWANAKIKMKDVARAFAQFGGKTEHLVAAIKKGYANGVRTGRIPAPGKNGMVLKNGSGENHTAPTFTQSTQPKKKGPNPNERPDSPSRSNATPGPGRGPAGLGEPATVIITASTAAVTAIAGLIATLKAKPENIHVGPGSDAPGITPTGGGLPSTDDILDILTSNDGDEETGGGDDGGKGGDNTEQTAGMSWWMIALIAMAGIGLAMNGTSDKPKPRARKEPETVDAEVISID